MPGLVPGIHVVQQRVGPTWMAGSSRHDDCSDGRCLFALVGDDRVDLVDVFLGLLNAGALDLSPHYPLVTRAQARRLRKRDRLEIQAGKFLEYPAPDSQSSLRY